VCHGASEGVNHRAQRFSRARTRKRTRGTAPTPRAMTRRRGLVAGSACETASIGTELPDQVVLPAGLLQAGVAGVVASLWAVPDATTAVLMARFHALWRSAEAPSHPPKPCGEPNRNCATARRSSKNFRYSTSCRRSRIPTSGLVRPHGRLGRTFQASSGRHRPKAMDEAPEGRGAGWVCVPKCGRTALAKGASIRCRCPVQPQRLGVGTGLQLVRISSVGVHYPYHGVAHVVVTDKRDL
jgi:CHAT domain